ncbi:MAG TPA: ribosome maturation factor RimP [Candidatus Eisenbergiella merdigallinarum]|uniref:Ribosome maturation factor RimP n=1 Tax=Candidatus Eisenbergiella merdigallinarum TaxID=2838552 RepID=A0A9D2MSN6_9FIRM|nr:ribosome maturation factor RimP [Candidatus Eisenbergiella merdigallinarum]
MSRRETYESRTEALLLPIAEENGVEIYDVEYVKEGSDWYLRAYIDKPGGVDINDCERVSRALSDRLDEEDFIEDAYVLEVSSPGLGRTLKKDKHLQRSLGEEVEIRLYKPVEKCREFAGTLKEFDAQSVTIQTAQGERAFDRKDVALIRLALDF